MRRVEFHLQQLPQDPQLAIQQLNLHIDKLNQVISVLMQDRFGDTIAPRTVYFGQSWPVGAQAPAMLVKYLPDGTFDDIEVM